MFMLPWLSEIEKLHKASFSIKDQARLLLVLLIMVHLSLHGMRVTLRSAMLPL